MALFNTLLVVLIVELLSEYSHGHPKPQFFRKDYTFLEETQAFYKVHTTRKPWKDAKKQCQSEGAGMFYPEDDVEAEAVMKLWKRSEPYGWIYLGISDLLAKGVWETVDGRPLLDVYSNWGSGQPDDTGGSEDCVLWRRDKTLNDYTCHEEYPFICKKSLSSLSSGAITETKPSAKPKPNIDRTDYTFIEESQAFYKVHRTRKAFHDARIQCRKDGAILFHPKDAVEAEAVMGLWNRTEPYGWIYLGATDLLQKGTFKTVDGRPLQDVYNNWGSGQPDHTGGNEDCVLWRRDMTLNDYTCHEEYPFICKMRRPSMSSDAVSEIKPTVKPNTSIDRKDYTFIEESQAFYKVHRTRKAFHDARIQCRKEGAILFHPEDAVEAEAVMGLWNRTEPYGWIYLGATDLLQKGTFKTIDGRPLQDVYNNWGSGQPDDTGGNEDCVLWRRDMTLNDYTCHEEYPFICKMRLPNMSSDAVSEIKPTTKPKPNIDRKDYSFIEESGAFYKVHTTRKAFHDARMQCQKEGAILFYPEDAVEAKAVMGLWNRTEPYGWIYLGVSDLLVKGTFETVDGRPLLDVYNNWGSGQPDDTGGNEDCVLWRRDMTLNDYTCHEEYPFICKMRRQSMSSDAVSEIKPTTKPKPNIDRKDYSFIEESGAFYKVHTTRKAFHDARMQCQKEGAILFYPEDAVEAEAVMGLWNRTEPYGWIYLGVSDLLVNGTFETVDGRPLLDVYINWGTGQPDDTGGNEDCVLWRRDMTLNDYTCHEEYPFICKMRRPSMSSDAVSEIKPTVKPNTSIDRKDYTFIEESQAFYKVHRTRKAFHDARIQCRKEGAILFHPEDAVEAEAVMGLWNRTEPYGWIYLGATDLLQKGTFKTVDGRPLQDVYNNWGSGQPDDTGGNEDCVLWRRDMTLNDYTCHEEYPFICKMRLPNMSSDAVSEIKPTTKPKPNIDRKDYSFIEESGAFYKVHTTRKAFHDARMQCQKEGAILFYPEDAVEAEAVMGLWNRTEPYGWIYLGVSDLLVKGTFETVDGRPLLDVYINWGTGQPDDTGGNEDCVLWHRDMTLNDYTCHEEYPFICKMRRPSMSSDAVSEIKPTVKPNTSIDRKDYTFIEESQAFYKVHRTRKAFHDARIQCRKEGAILFHPEDAVEAEAVMGLWNRTEPYGWIYLGATDLLQKGTFKTVDGRPLQDVYNNWGSGQPDDTGGNEDCVLWRRDMTLNDYTCHEEYPFICKMRLPNMSSDAVSEIKPTTKPKPNIDRKDYSFIEESGAFYKVHTTRKAFHDARMQCQKEGAILFYPEDAVEAEAVMGLWNRTEPYGWIYLGVSDLLVNGTFETVDGRPLLDVYINWGTGQPDDTGGNEDCVLWRRDMTLNDYTCHEEYPFICKMRRPSMSSDAVSEIKPTVKPNTSIDRKDYTFIEESQAFYKVHRTRKAFHDARIQCRKEGAILFHPEDAVEAVAVMGLWNRTEPYGWIYLGATDLLQKGTFKTVDGRPLQDVYNNWGSGQPDDTGGNEDCVLWRRDMTLNDYTCHEEYPFICKMRLPNMSSDAVSEIKPTTKPKPNIDRKDYSFIVESGAFYKVHTTRKAFHDARMQCQKEGAILFYPEDAVEAKAVMGLWNRTEPYGWIYLGVSDLLVKGTFETVDGRPLLDVYNNWGSGLPDDTGGNEDCVLWRRDMTLNDYTCHEEYPFICKMRRPSMSSDAVSEIKPTTKPKPNIDRKDYSFIEESGAFYKVHTTRKAFHDARMQCQKEGAILFYPEDAVEAKAVMGLWNRTAPYGWIYLGVSDLLVKGTFETVDGRPLLDVYNNWGSGLPDDTGGNEDCVLWRRDMTLNDYTCHEEYPFICKMRRPSMSSDAVSEIKPTTKPKPNIDRKDYSFIEESGAFYKVHTTRKAFHDARMQCQKEGAILFYPEDAVEAEAVMGLWNRTEPYGWIYLGVSDLLVNGTFETVDGRPLLDVYINWGTGQPDDTGGNEDCVLWRRDMTLNDYTCHEEYPFICKMRRPSMSSDAVSEIKPTVKPNTSIDRKDYTFIEESQAFYKVHRTRKAFHDARIQCRKEGAILFHPEDAVEAEAVMGLWNRTEPYGWIYLGATDLLQKGTFKTVDGRPLQDVYNNWGSGQPDDTGGNEDCVLWRRDMTLNDYTCHEEYPFICKMRLPNMSSDAVSEIKPTTKPKPNIDRKDYSFIEESGAFYKVHTTRKAFHDARMQCQKEGAILFYPEDAVEAKAVMGLWNRTEPYGWIYLGVSDLLVKGTFETVDGRPLLDVYNNWGSGLPDDTGGNEDCVLWRRDMTLNDYTCHEEYPFICKMRRPSMSSGAVSEIKPTTKPKPNIDRKDYSFIEESGAFYKVHTTRKAFHDARMQCQKEGAILFYPEDAVEAEAVMGLWNRTEPYGWIYLGVSDLLVNGTFETVDGRPLLDVYINWGTGQPDDTGGNEDCVLWRRDMTLNDYTCHEEYPFICKMRRPSMSSDAVSEIKPTVKPNTSIDRKDYTFIEESQAFYKVHRTRKAFHDARIQCRKEGAILFHPEDAVEAEAVMGLWNRTEPYGWIYLGATDLLQKGTFKTVDGRPLQDVYNNWGSGQPDDTGGNEDCVLWRRDMTLNDYTCHEEYPFICKMRLPNMSSDTVSEIKPTTKPKPNIDRKDYSFIEESGAFYKVHTTRKAFHDARMQCQKEGAILFYPEDAVEAKAVMGLWNRTEPYGWIYLGVSDLLVKGTFETVDGRPLLDVYNNWGSGLPDDTGGSEDCVLWRRDMTLNDYTCHEEYPFICKMRRPSMSSDAVSEIKPTTKPKPNIDRKDYSFIEESGAFYKVHTTRKAFHDARMQCQKEGAILFYPEDAVEAEAVMGLWNRTEPYGWIYLGVSDLLVNGTFETVDGRPLLDVYINWGTGQPDDTGGNEDCVLWRRDMTLNDYTCHEEYPFICKMRRPSMSSDAVSEIKPTVKPNTSIDRKDYTFIEESQAFYKVHRTRKAFHDARIQCRKEGAILFHPEDAVEAEAVMGLWNRTEPYGWIYLGATDLLQKGTFKTVDGRPLQDVYNNWGSGQPDDNGGNEDCVLWRRDMSLNDYTCHEEYPFICKMRRPSMSSDAVSQIKPTEKPKPSVDHKDYTFIEESQAFYKVHTTRKAFHDARIQCQKEGAILFHPEDALEAEVVMGLWNRTEPYGWIYLGVTDLLVEGNFETVDGRPLLDVYSNWGSGQPDDTGGNEDCVLWRRDKTLIDYTCHEEYPFICKKNLASLSSDAITENKPCIRQKLMKPTKVIKTDKPKRSIDRKDYTFIEESQAYYKVHTTRKAFHDARMQCQKEGAILFYPEDAVEAEAVMGLWNRTEPYGWIYLGVTDLLVKGTFETVDGRLLLDVYSKWGTGQPDNTGGNEDCVLWRRDKTLNDYTCHEDYPFICKKSRRSLYLDTTNDTRDPSLNSIAPMMSTFFRKDYTFIEESHAFYKIHTIHRTWQDARKRCQMEGASLFYPEDEVEAQAVMGFWERTQPFERVYLGISDLLIRGKWETVDGRPLSEVYNHWGYGQPDSVDGIEDCVIWHRDRTLNDYTCHEKNPFICKKSQRDLNWNTLCDMPDSSYHYNKDFGKCYKFHLTPKNWTDAHAACSAEQSYLAIINSQSEAEYLAKMTQEATKHKIRGNFLSGAVYLGFHNKDNDGWKTVKGTSLEDSGYTGWGNQQPDGGDKESCGSMFYNGRLNDLGCSQRCFFICEHDIGLLGNAVDERFGSF